MGGHGQPGLQKPESEAVLAASDAQRAAPLKEGAPSLAPTSHESGTDHARPPVTLVASGGDKAPDNVPSPARRLARDLELELRSVQCGDEPVSAVMMHRGEKPSKRLMRIHFV